MPHYRSSANIRSMHLLSVCRSFMHVCAYIQYMCIIIYGRHKTTFTNV
uniref:Uncharacterized protein n=1 Tax=Anguilla anguilla TaxID=7936 RepID=A0A0E9UK43_ANGAN